MAAERKLFGTDGVRGEVGAFLTAELAMALGRAAVASLEADRPQVLIVRDTRESGPMLESALAAGVAEAGGDALLGGVLPTPAAAILVKRLGLDLAAVVSASHNPYRDNGIKFFSGAGTKLSDEVEAGIEGHDRLRPDGRARRPRARARRRDGGLPAGAGGRLPARSEGRHGRARLRQRRHPQGRADRSSSASGRRSRRSRSSPTARTSTTAAGRPSSISCAVTSPAPRRRSGSPSTATATGSWRSTGPAAPTTATS